MPCVSYIFGFIVKPVLYVYYFTTIRVHESLISFQCTGTFCTLDICLSRLEDIGTVDVCQTVRRMRTQRAFSIQTWDQYYFCYTAVIEYAQCHGKLSPVQWSDSDIETDSE